MPSALETLVKILKLEREQGYKNTAVIGGLGAFGDKWSLDAHAQARKQEHHLLVDELFALLKKYDALESRNDRHQTVGYMLDRITGRVPPPPEYQAPATSDPLADAEPQPESESPRPPADRPQDDRSAEQSSRQEQRQEARARSAGREQRQQDNRERQKGARPPRPQHQPPPGKGRPREKSEERGEMEFADAMEFSGGRGSGPAVLDIPAPPRLARPPRRSRPALDPEQAEQLLNEMKQDVQNLKGVGPNKAALLKKLGIETIHDLLYFLPRRYDDYTRLLPIRRLQPNILATVIGTVKSTEIRIAANGRKDFFMTFDDGSAEMVVTFFGQGIWRNRDIKPGHQLVLRGQTSIWRNRIQMTNPEWEHLDVDNLQRVGIVPVYPLTEGLSAREMRRLARVAVETWADRVPDIMPEPVLERAELADINWTLRNLHVPEGPDHLHHAKRRFIFDQLILLQLAILRNRRAWQSVPSDPLHVSDEWLEAFLQAVFPYPLTGAQRRAINDIRADIGKTVPMNRLLQGDVGSGKTAVAITALAMAVANGKQAAIMAPTSILAEQHYRGMSRALENMPGDRRPVIALLTSALTTTERQSIYRGLADGSIDIVVGTHAIIQEGVEFKDLAVAVIDEQHRFGVEQRGTLRGKGRNPHLLIMTATPIPRTLALTLYADLDLSIIDEMPPGRIPIQTRVIEPSRRERIYNFIESQLEQGRQAFVVYPLVEASEKIDAESATEAYERLQKIFYNYRVGLLHGRMKPQEKDEIMTAFRDKAFDVLVTTSVAEVGVDIPNATVMMIEGANRFGLAQLHQFRGRVGRGGHASYCLLVCDTDVADARERLEAMEQFSDGFKLAEIDWQLRGPGDLVGTRQSGQALLKLVDDMSPELVALAQREAKTLYEEDPELQRPEHRLLARSVQNVLDDRSDLS